MGKVVISTLYDMPGIDVTHPEIAAQWHPVKNGNFLPSQVTYGSNKKVWWRCPKTCPQGCPHDWESTIKNRCKGNGCPYCSQRATSCEHISITHTHPKIASQWHPIKNSDLLPSQFTAGSNKKFWWKCPKTCPQGCPHEWGANINDRCNGNGCPCCSQRVASCEHVSITHTHPDIAAQWHPTKNIDLLPSQFTAGSNKKMWWICPKTCPQGCPHEWVAVITSRCGNGNGCPYCSNQIIRCEHVSITHTYPEIAAHWHPTKNGELSPSHFSFGSDKKVWWNCSNNSAHEWIASIGERCRGSGCPHCVNKTEAKLQDYLKSLFPDTETQYRADWCKSPTSSKHLPFDFYIPSLKLIIELDGPQHFRQISNWKCHHKTAKRDVYKMQQAAAQGVSMLRLVQEEVLDASPEWLEEQVKPHLIYHEPPTQTLLSVTNPDLYMEHLHLLADTDTISIEESDSGSNVSDEGDDEDDEEVEESSSSDDIE